MRPTLYQKTMHPKFPVVSRKWVSRVALITSTAAVGFVTLWNSNFSLEWLLSHSSTKKQSAAAARIAPLSTPSRAVLPTSTDVAVAFPGINSSVSKVAQSLILTGTILGRNRYEGSAFIGVDERNPQTYVAGALLANGARLTEIGKDYVVLERNGKSVRLYMPNAKGYAEPSRANRDILMVGGPQHFTPAVATDSDLITDFIRPSPIYDGDVLIGYQVYAGRSAATFAKLGLQAGDLITSIDGAPLSDAQSAMEMLRQLTNGIELTATVKRNGKSEGITLDGSIILTELDQAKRHSDDATRIAALPPS